MQGTLLDLTFSSFKKQWQFLSQEVTYARCQMSQPVKSRGDLKLGTQCCCPSWESQSPLRSFSLMSPSPKLSLIALTKHQTP